MIGSKPDKETIFNFWIILDENNPGRISDFWKSELETDGGYFKGQPTRLYNMGYGYDTDNVLMLASLTYPKGQPEFGGITVLGAATNYMTIISRTFDNTGLPFSFQDKMYGVQQVSPGSFYYYTHFHLSYLTNLAGFYSSPVYVHLAGSHTTKKNEIYLSTYTLKENHSMVHEYSRIFQGEGTVNIMKVGQPVYETEDDLWIMYVFYQETSLSNRGKLLYTDMETSYEVITYYFQEEQKSIDGNRMDIQLKHFQYLPDSEYFIYGGTANYIRGYGDEIDKTFSWMDTNRKFGFFTLWTTNEECYVNEEKPEIVWGPRYQEYLDGLEDILIRHLEDTLPVVSPEEQYNMGDLDADNFDDLLLEQRKVDEDGFWVEYRSWRYYDKEENEEQYLMFFIEGTDWLDRFNIRTSVEFRGKAREGSLAILALGLWGLIQVGLGVLVWYGFLEIVNLTTDPVNTYWGSWCVVFILLIGLEGGLFAVWPATYYGTSLSLDFALAFAKTSIAGPYGLYEGALIFLALTMWVFPTETGYATNNLLTPEDIEKAVFFSAVAVDFGINTFFSLFFTPQV